MRAKNGFPRGRYATLLIIGIAFFMAGCAGIRVTSVASYAPNAALVPPRTISVAIQNDSPPPKKESRRAQQLIDAQTASAEIGAQLQKLLSSRQWMVVSASQPADLVLRCRILDVKGGSDALRILVGYGAGKAVLRVEVSLIDLRGNETSSLLSFETDGTSGSMPPGPGGINQGLPKEIVQTVANINKQLSKYFAEQKWQ